MIIKPYQDVFIVEKFQLKPGKTWFESFTDEIISITGFPLPDFSHLERDENIWEIDTDDLDPRYEYYVETRYNGVCLLREIAGVVGQNYYPPPIEYPYPESSYEWDDYWDNWENLPDRSPDLIKN